MAAMKHRKLFPTPASTNQTDCPDYCDPTCPYGCDPYGDFYFMPPSPPPPPRSTAQAQPLSLYLIIMASLLGSFFLLLGYYLFVAKCCSRSPPTQSDHQDQDFLDENHGPEAIHHPIWFIRTVGLQPSVIDSITVFKYKKGDVLIEGSECSVCLSEFRDEETLRLLPKCNHAFHIPCIDTWLRSHTNCPLCRAGILSNTWGASNPPASNDLNRPNLGLQEETQVDNSDSNAELGSDSNAELGNNRISSSGINENLAETESEVELPRFEGERKEFDDPKDGVNSLSVVEPEGDSISRRDDLQQSERDTVEIQDMENSTTNRVQIGRDSITQSVQKFPVSLKRSFSYGGSLFIPRHTRNSSSILPL